MSEADNYVAKEYAEGGDACMDALKSNWDGILAGAILEILQWSYRFIGEDIIGVFGLLMRQTPILGLFMTWWVSIFNITANADWSRTFAHGI